MSVELIAYSELDADIVGFDPQQTKEVLRFLLPLAAGRRLIRIRSWIAATNKTSGSPPLEYNLQQMPTYAHLFLHEKGGGRRENGVGSWVYGFDSFEWGLRTDRVGALVIVITATNASQAPFPPLITIYGRHGEEPDLGAYCVVEDIGEIK